MTSKVNVNVRSMLLCTLLPCSNLPLKTPAGIHAVTRRPLSPNCKALSPQHKSQAKQSSNTTAARRNSIFPGTHPRCIQVVVKHYPKLIVHPGVVVPRNHPLGTRSRQAAIVSSRGTACPVTALLYLLHCHSSLFTFSDVHATRVSSLQVMRSDIKCLYLFASYPEENTKETNANVI